MLGRMDPRQPLDAVRPLLEAPSPAVLTLYRADGSALVSPVWFRVHGEDAEVVIGEGDGKLAHLARDRRCVLVIFETTPPLRRVEVRGEAALSSDWVAEARLAIASRYLGVEGGRRLAEQRGARGYVLRLPMRDARVWSLDLATSR